MRHGTRQLSGKRARHGAWHPATGLILRRHVAGFYSAVDTRGMKLGNPNGATALRRAGKGGTALQETVRRNADTFAGGRGRDHP